MKPLKYIENRSYEEIRVGDSATITRTLKPEDIQLFAIMSGDVNPVHVDPEYTKSSNRPAHGQRQAKSLDLKARRR